MTPEERFWSHVQKGPGCWLWTASGQKYGKMRWHGRLTSAHRISWEIAFGPVPDGLHVLHHCDVPKCVRMDHLFIGTQIDNSHDQWRKGRGKAPIGPVRGEQDAASKLTVEQVMQIRVKYANGSLTYKQLAREYNMSKSAICDVVTRHTWQHVPSPS